MSNYDQQVDKLNRLLLAEDVPVELLKDLFILDVNVRHLQLQVLKLEAAARLMEGVNDAEVETLERLERLSIGMKDDDFKEELFFKLNALKFDYEREQILIKVVEDEINYCFELVKDENFFNLVAAKTWPTFDQAWREYRKLNESTPN